MQARAIGTVILGLVLFSCSGAKSPPAADVSRPPDNPTSMPPEVWAEETSELPDGAAVVAADNEFGFELFERLFSEKPGENLFISPTSIAMALAMTYNGAEEETRQAMAEALRLEGMEPADASMANAALLAMLRSADPKVTVEVANALWVRRGINLADRFRAMNEDCYEAEVSDLDFRDEASVEVINGWVREKTHEKIEKIVSSLDPSDVLLLVNAVYFKGRWTEEFDKGLTGDEVFHAPTGDRQHPMMRRTGEYRYFAGDGLQAIRLPYGDGRFGMVVLLPDEGEELGVLVGRLTADGLGEWLDAMAMRDGSIVLPRFKVEYEKKLNTALSDLGMGVAFDPAGANFNGMLPSPIDMPFYISEVLHKSFVEVNEEGTEAAAVTGVKMALTAMPRDRFRMVVDRPFVFVIHDEETDAALFLGVVNEPEE